ncbi:hypothetical protein KR032_005281 [Drosophila birchii]|nr:hypothetical protein KR032_005281 [Drosophila birchii]
MEIAAKGMLSASGYDKYYLEQFNKFYEDYRACNIKTANWLFKLENNNIEKHYENLSLKRRLHNMTQQKTNLEDRLSLQEKLYAEVDQKYIDALKTRIAVEKGSKSVISQQKAKLDKNYAEIGWLKVELNNTQESNRGMAKTLSDIQVKLKQTEEAVADLVNQNKIQAAEFKEQKLKMQNTAAERDDLKHQNSQLESELKQKTLECSGLNQLQMDFEALQSYTEEITNQLELSRNEIETKNNSLNELEGLRFSLIEVCEEYYTDSVEYKKTISSLRSSLNQQTQDLEKLAKSHEELKAANLQQLSLHGEEQQKYEAQAMNLREVIKSFETEVQVQAQSMQAEKESLVVELDELRKSNSSLEADKKQMENDKKTFAEEVENTTNNLKNTIFSLQKDLKDSEIKLIGLEHEKDDIIKQLKNKIDKICSTIKQPIVGSTLPKNDKRNKISAIEIESDFESEDEMPVKILFSTRQNLAVVKPQEDVFDALKNGTI